MKRKRLMLNLVTLSVSVLILDACASNSFLPETPFDPIHSCMQRVYDPELKKALTQALINPDYRLLEFMEKTDQDLEALWHTWDSITHEYFDFVEKAIEGKNVPLETFSKETFYQDLLKYLVENEFGEYIIQNLEIAITAEKIFILIDEILQYQENNLVRDKTAGLKGTGGSVFFHIDKSLFPY